MLTSGDVVRMIEEHRPTSRNDLISMGLDPILVGQGTCRNVYKVHRDLVVKMGNGSSTTQSDSEIDFITEVYSPAATDELRKLRKHVPPLYYTDKENGVIVMKYYHDRLKNRTPEFRELEKVMNNAGVGDIHLVNSRRDDQGNIVVVDLGIITR